MNTTITKEQHSQVLLTIEVPQEELEKYENEATTRISQKVSVPGFRKGQAPKYLIISQVGPEAFQEEVINLALTHTYFKAVQEHKVEAISRPQIKLLSPSPLKYEARVAVMSEVTVEGLDKLVIKKEETPVTDKDIDEVINEMRKYHATFKPLDRAVSKGDKLEIDFQGYDEGGALLDATRSSNHPLFVGEGSLIPGFEDQLIGMKVGEQKKFPITFPKDYHHEPFRLKKVNFEVTIKKGEETQLPELNEVFVEKITSKKASPDEFKKLIRGDLEARKQSEDYKRRENALIEKFLELGKLDVPPVLVEEEVSYMLDELRNDIEGRGMKFETFLEEMKKKKKNIDEEYKPEALKRVKIRLILNHLFRHLKITTEEAEMEKAAEALLDRAPAETRGRVEAELKAKKGVYLKLQNNLMLEKLFRHFLEKPEKE